jgi:exonuclease 3'-5' domain-containing protein 1
MPFGISLDGMRDIQLMELACRADPASYVSGLAKCIERHAPIRQAEKIAWKATKVAGHELYAPEVGGAFEVFNERPMKPEIIAYSTQDVTFLPGLYQVFQTKLADQAFWLREVEATTKKRIEQSQSPEYDSQKDARGPWTKEYLDGARDQWWEEKRNQKRGKW